MLLQNEFGVTLRSNYQRLESDPGLMRVHVKWGRTCLRNAVELGGWLWCHKLERRVAVIGVLFVFIREEEWCLEAAVRSRDNVHLSSWCLGRKWMSSLHWEAFEEGNIITFSLSMCWAHLSAGETVCTCDLGRRTNAAPKSMLFPSSILSSQGGSVR